MKFGTLLCSIFALYKMKNYDLLTYALRQLKILHRIPRNTDGN